jgi:TolB-like protein
MIPLALIGCATPGGADASFHDPNMDFSLIQSLAVLPFDNLTAESRASDRVRDVFMTMLQATGALYVVPPGEVARAVSRVGLQDPTGPTAEEVVNLAKNLEADVVVTGSVLEYGEVRSASASANVISVSVQMMEGQTGRVVWSASATRGGIGATKRLFGGGGEPMNTVTTKAVEDLLDALFK